MKRRRRWLVPTGMVLAAGCGSATGRVDSAQGSQADVRTPLAASAGTEFALLPTTGVQEFSGTPTSWTAKSIATEFAVSIDNLPTAPMPTDEAVQFLQVEPSGDRPVHQLQASVDAVGNGLMTLPVASWEKAVANPGERMDLEEATLTLGPLGDVTRTIAGSLSEGTRYSLESEHLNDGSDVCSTCDTGFADAGASAAIGDRYVSIFKVPSSATDLEVDLPFWAVDDALVSETLVLVEFETEDQKGSISWVDSDGENQRHDVGSTLTRPCGKRGGRTPRNRCISGRVRASDSATA